MGTYRKVPPVQKSSYRSTEALSLTAKTLRLIERRFCPCEHEKGCGCQCAELQDDRWRKTSGQDVALKIDPKNFLRDSVFQLHSPGLCVGREAGKVLNEIIPEVHLTLPLHSDRY